MKASYPKEIIRSYGNNKDGITIIKVVFPSFLLLFSTFATFLK